MGPRILQVYRGRSWWVPCIDHWMGYILSMPHTLNREHIPPMACLSFISEHKTGTLQKSPPSQDLGQVDQWELILVAVEHQQLNRFLSNLPTTSPYYASALLY